MQKRASDEATEGRVVVMRNSGRVFQAAGLLVERRFVGGVDDGRRSVCADVGRVTVPPPTIKIRLPIFRCVQLQRAYTSQRVLCSRQLYPAAAEHCSACLNR